MESESPHQFFLLPLQTTKGRHRYLKGYFNVLKLTKIWSQKFTKIRLNKTVRKKQSTYLVKKKKVKTLLVGGGGGDGGDGGDGGSILFFHEGIL